MSPSGLVPLWTNGHARVCGNGTTFHSPTIGHVGTFLPHHPQTESPPAHPTAPPQVHSLQELRRSASLATKVFVQRDYSDGTTCQFQTKFPPELESRVGCLAACVGVPYIQSPMAFP